MADRPSVPIGHTGLFNKADDQQEIILFNIFGSPKYLVYGQLKKLNFIKTNTAILF